MLSRCLRTSRSRRPLDGRLIHLTAPRINEDFLEDFLERNSVRAIGGIKSRPIYAGNCKAIDSMYQDGGLIVSRACEIAVGPDSMKHMM